MAYNVATCARLGPDRISVQNWLTGLYSAFRGEYSISTTAANLNRVSFCASLWNAQSSTS